MTYRRSVRFKREFALLPLEIWIRLWQSDSTDELG
jgi:hypothetical protein